jgi:D-ribose pyranase
MAEWSIDRVVITHEMDDISPERVAELERLLGEVPLERVSHLELKRLAETAHATVRTGDTTPYANLILVSG